ncbi:MAG TPA: carbohydrate ABC transporter permease [Mycobacteriales bacterium]|jgi:multiple sugar transport system permease protein|nr:carbohydrate ABC transporter permease [Mycobacteriales bacterium]
MASNARKVRGWRQQSARAAAYGVLVVAALVVLLPFVIAFTTSLKEPDDVFNYPPKVLPRAVKQVAVGGKPADLYTVTVDGKSREMALAQDGISVGVYADPANPGDEIVVEQAKASGLDRKATVDGVEHSLYTVQTPTGSRELYRKRSALAARFVAPDDPSVTVVTNRREAVAVTELTARPENYGDVLDLDRLDRSLTNTVLVTLLVVGGQVLTSIMGGYAFARISFGGRDKLFLVYLGSVMIPFVVLIIPLYQLMVTMGWVDSLVSLIVPFIFSAYGTFLMRQFFVTLPKELEEAAFIDGASRWKILWRIFVPLSVPAIATLSTFSFLYAWNSFVWPLVVINSGNLDNRVLALSLSVLGGRAADQPNLILAGVMIALIPPITVFVLAQRYFVENVASSGLKG